VSTISLSRPKPRTAGARQPSCDPWLLGSVLALVGLGLVMVYSTSISLSESSAGSGSYFVLRQLAAVTLGFFFMYLVMHSPLRLWQAAGPYLLLAGITLLALVLLPGIGVSANGSSRWLRLGMINLQPSEVIKLVLIVYVAGYFVRRQDDLHSFTHGVLIISIVVAVIGMLLLQEPDLGAVVVVCLTALGMLFLAGVRLWHFGLIAAVGMMTVALLTVVRPYRWERVATFLDPWADPFDSGFQLVQALIAFGRGGWFGVGLGASVQKLHYLPAAHTDFLFAVTAEELGLIGVLAVMTLFAVVTARAFAISKRAEEAELLFGARLAQGIGLLLGVQATISIGVNMGVLPTKGLTLPFMSYGGSSALVSLVSIGLLLMIDREARKARWGAP
jgi:cell division protein FtsW